MSYHVGNTEGRFSRDEAQYYSILIMSSITRELYLRMADGDITFEPAHEIMALFVLLKLVLQKRMRSHPMGQDI